MFKHTQTIRRVLFIKWKISWRIKGHTHVTTLFQKIYYSVIALVWEWISKCLWNLYRMCFTVKHCNLGANWMFCKLQKVLKKYAQWFSKNFCFIFFFNLRLHLCSKMQAGRHQLFKTLIKLFKKLDWNNLS